MWWIVFTAVDLYIGLILLDVMAGSLPAEKRRGVGVAKKIIIALLILLGVALVVVLARR